MIFNPVQAPNPPSGKLRFIPEKKTIATGLSVEDSARMIVSMGAVTPDVLDVLRPYLTDVERKPAS